MKKTFIAIVAATFGLQGCTTLNNLSDMLTDQDQPEMMQTRDTQLTVVNVPTQSGGTPILTMMPGQNPQTTAVDAFGSTPQQPRYGSGQGAYSSSPLTKHIGDYVQNMTQDLITNMEYLTDRTPVGVTTFALLDSDLQQTNLLGHQMAESFVHELHKFRIPVIDFKATNFVRVTPEGDFVLSRDYMELDSDLDVRYVLTGTMVRHQGGYLVNARILGKSSKVVVASSQMLIPFYVVDALLTSNGMTIDGVGFAQGSR